MCTLVNKILILFFVVVDAMNICNHVVVFPKSERKKCHWSGFYYKKKIAELDRFNLIIIIIISTMVTLLKWSFFVVGKRWFCFVYGEG